MWLWKSQWPARYDKRLPNQFIGQLRPEILTLP